MDSTFRKGQGKTLGGALPNLRRRSWLSALTGVEPQSDPGLPETASPSGGGGSSGPKLWDRIQDDPSARAYGEQQGATPMGQSPTQRGPDDYLGQLQGERQKLIDAMQPQQLSLKQKLLQGFVGAFGGPQLNQRLQQKQEFEENQNRERLGAVGTEIGNWQRLQETARHDDQLVDRANIGKTVTLGDKVKQWNPKTQSYDIDLGYSSGQPEHIETDQGPLQYNRENKDWDPITVGGKPVGPKPTKEMGTVDPIIEAQLGPMPDPRSNPQAAQAWGVRAQKIKEKMQTDPGLARVLAMQEAKPVQVIIDGKPVWVKAGDAIKSGAFAGGAAQANELTGQASIFSELHRNLDMLDKSADFAPQSLTEKMQVSAGLRQPSWIGGELLTGAVRGTMSQGQQDLVNSLRTTREGITAFRKFLANSPLRSDTQLNLMLSQLPDVSDLMSGNKDEIRNKINNFRGELASIEDRFNTLMGGAGIAPAGRGGQSPPMAQPSSGLKSKVQSQAPEGTRVQVGNQIQEKRNGKWVVVQQ